MADVTSGQGTVGELGDTAVTDVLADTPDAVRLPTQQNTVGELGDTDD